MNMSGVDQFPAGYLQEDNGSRAIAACTIILVLTTVLFPLRCYARSLTPGQREWDDHLLIPAYFLLLGLIASVYAEVTQAGLGRHTSALMIEDPSGSMISKYLKLLYILTWFYVPSNALSRVSVVCMYLRIFTDRWARAACWTVMAFLVANALGVVIASQLECAPLAYAWDKSIPGGTCFDQILYYQLSNFPNIVGDVMIAILPIKTVWTIKASLARKAGVATVCLTGSIGMIASCIRTSIFYLQVDVIRNDPTFCDEAFSWTVIECGMYFSAACLIGMRPLFAKFPTFLKTQFTTANADKHGLRSTGLRSTFGQRKTDRLTLQRHGKINHYANMQFVQEEDAERGLRHQSTEEINPPLEGGIPLPGYQVRDPFAGADSDMGDVYLETGREVRHEDGAWAYRGNDGDYGQEYYVYSEPVYAHAK